MRKNCSLVADGGVGAVTGPVWATQAAPSNRQAMAVRRRSGARKNVMRTNVAAQETVAKKNQERERAHADVLRRLRPAHHSRLICFDGVLQRVGDTNSPFFSAAYRETPEPARASAGGLVREARRLFDVADLAQFEGDLHIFVDVNFLGAQIDYARGLSEASGDLIDGLAKSDGWWRAGWGWRRSDRSRSAGI